MIEISPRTRNQLYQLLKNRPNSFGDHNSQDGIITFLEKIWDLRELPSTDLRSPYNKDFHADVWQHMINNDDWDYDYLFIERLNLLKDPESFIKFIETILHPEIRENENEVKLYYDLINPYLIDEGCQLVLDDYDEFGRPVYKILSGGKIDDIPYNIKINKIPFYVSKYNMPYESEHAVKPTPSTPAFLLLHNQWDDFGYKTSFSLHYFSENDTCTNLGGIKLMKDDEGRNTYEALEDTFTSLDHSFCSLGQDISYYEKLSGLFPETYKSILYAIRDASFFPQIEESFERNEKFKTSLIRNDEAERSLREAKYLIEGYDFDTLYSFSYSFKPLFSDTPVDIDLNFENKSDFPSRIIAIIGKNGTGKTQLITALPVDFSKKKNDKFKPKLPIFSKVITVSYSIFDNFEIPNTTAEFNYVYCGLRNKEDQTLSEKGLKNRFHSSRKKIQKLGRVDRWRKILSNFLEEEVIEDFFRKKENNLGLYTDEYESSLDGFHKITDRLSSGQSIILYIITEIVANIRLDSLILYDEPETHLHPNAISQLINTIYELIDEFQSYCLMTTHSPLIIREIPSKDVFVISREGNTPSVRRIGLESFGENLTTLTEEVFGNKSIPKQYQMIIQDFVDNGKSFDEIINTLEYDEIPLSLNARIYIKNLIKVRDEES